MLSLRHDSHGLAFVFVHSDANASAALAALLRPAMLPTAMLPTTACA